MHISQSYKVLYNSEISIIRTPIRVFYQQVYALLEYSSKLNINAKMYYLIFDYMNTLPPKLVWIIEVPL